MSHFTLKPEEYKRNLDFKGSYLKLISVYLSRMMSWPMDKAVAFVARNTQPDGRFPFKDPQVNYLQRQKNGDRVKQSGRLSEYVDLVSQRQFLMAPTMTVYLNPTQRKSHNAVYIQANKALRKKYKTAMFDAKMEGNEELESYYDGLQGNCKIKNNSMSGTHASPSTPLYLKSGHSTLTSTCRISTSYANAGNEWLISGNRHFHKPAIVLISLLNAVEFTDFEALQLAMVTYGIHYPSPKDVEECIKRSSDLYWYSMTVWDEILKFVSVMTPLERAAFVYLGDMFHLAKHNPNLVTDFFRSLHQPAMMPVDNPDEWLGKCDGDQKTLVSLICSDIMDGRTIKKVKSEDPHGYGRLGATAKNIIGALDHYKVLIQGILRPSILPTSIAVMPMMVRRAVVTSDTDSTIFTNQYWADWFTNGNLFCPAAYQIGYVMTYIASQMVKHKLAIMSANIGAIPEHIHSISMKNEYYFPVYSLTPVAKHYFAYRSAQEGNVFKHLETEIKGVHLRDSSAPAHVTKQLKGYIEYIMTSVMQKRYLTVDEILDPVATLELSIINDIMSGGFGYMKSARINDAASYIDGENAPPYQHYKMWERVFASKYGTPDKPPYPAVRVNVDLDGPVKINAWLAKIEDRAMAQRIKDWLDETGKTSLSSLLLPRAILEVKGIPAEIVPAIDVRKLVMAVVSPFYLVLEAVGLYMQNDNITRLVSDTHVPSVVRVNLANNALTIEPPAYAGELPPAIQVGGDVSMNHFVNVMQDVQRQPAL